jgi:hypothetical protein
MVILIVAQLALAEAAMHEPLSLDGQHLDYSGSPGAMKNVVSHLGPAASVLADMFDGSQVFEFMHLTENDDMAALHLLVKNGYQVQRILGDVLAIRCTPPISPSDAPR